MPHLDQMNSQLSTGPEAEINRLQLEILTLRNEQGSVLITIAEYILARLEQLGVRSMFGVPGDFFLRFLDYVEDHPTIQWVGECNELNAVYAADGYARFKRTLAVVVTTYGPGELSTINGLAGSFSEELPVLHIVGGPSTTKQHERPIIRHQLDNERYDVFLQCARQVTCAQAILTGKEDATEKIDQLLVECITQSRPVYLTLPTDLIEAKISSARLRYPLAPLETEINKDAEEEVIHRIYDLFKQANGDAVVIVDAGVVRHHCRFEIVQFLLETKLPVYATPLGKTIVDENYGRYGGVYFAHISRDDVKQKVESAKLIVLIGSIRGNLSTRNFFQNLPRDRTIELHFDHTEIFSATYPGVGMKLLLPKLTRRFEEFSEQASQIPVPEFASGADTRSTTQITHAWFWPRLGQWFKRGDVILTETGTASYGILDVRLPAGSVLLAQMLWCSIGWSVGATHGASLALKETVDIGTPSRTILFIGDGSLQVAVQELSVMIRSDIKPIIFVLNNSGYTIERFFNGKDGGNRKYTDIVNWDWTLLPKALGDIAGEVSRTYQVRNASELEALLSNEEFGEARYIQLVEVVMDRFDVPDALKRSKSEPVQQANTDEVAADLRECSLTLT